MQLCPVVQHVPPQQTIFPPQSESSVHWVEPTHSTSLQLPSQQNCVSEQPRASHMKSIHAPTTQFSKSLYSSQVAAVQHAFGFDESQQPAKTSLMKQQSSP